MRFDEVAEPERRVLICAPHGRDGQLLTQMLSGHEIVGEPQPNIEALSDELKRGAAVVIVTEEALAGAIHSLTEAMQNQPPWSDMPVILLTTGGEISSEKAWAFVTKLEPIGNVSLLERPLRAMTLVSAVQTALRSRLRQYEVRALHEDLEARVAARTAELQRLNDEAEGFSYTIAHDLRSPLRSIISTSRVLLEDHRDKLSGEAAQQLERQAIAAGRLANLIDDLLRLSRLSREQMSLVELDLSTLAQEVAEGLSPEFESTACRFNIQPNMKAFGDPLLLRFAVLNLIQNACKFSPNGGCVSVGCCGDVYYVSDEGIGFSPAYAKKIFEPFERLENKGRFPGTGIGLANVKRIIERHGGQVWAESELGKGAKFLFRLPKKAIRGQVPK